MLCWRSAGIPSMKSWPPLSPSSLCFLATRMWAVWLHPEIPVWCAFHYRPQTSSTKWPGTKTSETLSPDEPTVPLSELVVSSISYREASVCHTVVAESATALCPRTNFNQPEKKMSSDATDLPDLLGCWVTLSSAGFCLTALSSRYWQSFHTAFQRLPNSQKKWHHNNLPLGGQGSWGPWRQAAEVAIRGGMAMLGPIHCRIVTSSG